MPKYVFTVTGVRLVPKESGSAKEPKNKSSPGVRIGKLPPRQPEGVWLGESLDHEFNELNDEANELNDEDIFCGSSSQ